MTSRPFLDVHDATLIFGQTIVLDDVSFAAAEGETIGVIGPNGAGKTSTLNAISGLVRLSEGGVELMGHAIDRMRPDDVVRLGVGRCFQSTDFFKSLTPLQLVELASVGRSSLRALFTRSASSAAGRRHRRGNAAMDVLEAFGLAEFATTRLSELPNGVQKRADLARASISGTRMLLLDEPTSGLSAAERPDIERVLAGLKSPDRAIVIVDHDPGFVARNCDRIVAMNFGRVLAVGNPLDVLRSAEVRDSYLGSEATNLIG